MAGTKVEKLEGGRRPPGVTAPSEGGWGWMIVAGCFLATICIRAVTRCVSMFFVEFQLHFEKDYSTTAWINSLIDATTMLCAPLGGFLGNRLSCRATVILGGLLSSSGLVLSSFASSLEYLYISLGILPGSGIGTFILAPAVQLLIEHYSWRGALLILGGFVSNLCVCGALMREPRRSEGIWENKMANLEKDCIATALDSKDTEQVPADCSQVEAKKLEIHNLMDTQRLLIANGALKNFDLKNNKLVQGNIALLSSSSPCDRKIADCILFHNKLTETMTGELKRSDPKLANASTIEGLKLVESVKLNKTADMDVKIAEPLVSTNSSSRDHCFSLESREEFGFLVKPDFLILSVSLLFLAYGCSAPVVYLVPYALSMGLEPQQAAFLMSIFGVSGIVGNITFGWITDRKCLKRYRMLSYMIAIGMDGLCCMFIHLLRSFPHLIPYSVLYGYFDGAYVALIPVVTSDVAGSTYLTSALGVVFFLHGIPYLISPPIGGWLVDRTGNYKATFFLSGTCFMFSSVVLGAAMLVRRCQTSKSNSAAHSQSKNPNPTAAAAQQGII